MQMRILIATTLVALSLAGSLGTASAQRYDYSAEPPQQGSSHPSTQPGATGRGYFAE
jgi:hypothetical protein